MMSMKLKLIISNLQIRHYKVCCLQRALKQSLRHSALEFAYHGFLSADIPVAMC